MNEGNGKPSPGSELPHLGERQSWKLGLQTLEQQAIRAALDRRALLLAWAGPLLAQHPVSQRPEEFRFPRGASGKPLKKCPPFLPDGSCERGQLVWEAPAGRGDFSVLIAHLQHLVHSLECHRCPKSGKPSWIGGKQKETDFSSIAK